MLIEPIMCRFGLCGLKLLSKKGCGAKMIFPQLDTISLIFMYYFSGDEID